jgi:predicted enzyme related to lactoylglutathione lyase
MIQGLRTAIYNAPDLAKAKAWYTKILGFGPYFDEPFYVGFNVGGYELGLLPKAKAVDRGGVTVYWGVADAEAAVKMLLEAGAELAEPVQDVGEGIKTAAVLDPFGNVFGVIENPYFKLRTEETDLHT